MYIVVNETFIKMVTFWLIWHTCQWAYAIIICPSYVIVVVIGVVVSIVVIVIVISIGICVHLSQWEPWLQKLHIMWIYAHILLVCAHQILD